MKMDRPTIQTHIREIGCAVIAVHGGGEAPSFAYTIGLHASLGFEIVVVGLPLAYSHAILNDICAKSKEEGFELPLGVPDPRWANFPGVFRVCDPEKVRPYVHLAFDYHGHTVPVVQLVYPDRSGRFPEDPAFDHPYMDDCQTLLYSNLH